MAFLSETITIPFWFIVFVIASAAPLWLKWYQIFHKKFIISGILKRKFHHVKSTAETKIDILKKATDNWKENSEAEKFTESEIKKTKGIKAKIDPVKKDNIKMVLTALAELGEKGGLPKSVSDITKINNVDTAGALTYLVEKKYAEEITGTLGAKYYLTSLGRKYCVNKKIISDV